MGVALFVCLLVGSGFFSCRNHLRVESKQKSIWSLFSFLGQIKKKLDFNPNRSHFALAMCLQQKGTDRTPASTCQLCLFLAQISSRAAELQQQGQEGAAVGIPGAPVAAARSLRGQSMINVTLGKKFVIKEYSKIC